jgi:hypothetical protein
MRRHVTLLVLVLGVPASAEPGPLPREVPLDRTGRPLSAGVLARLTVDPPEGHSLVAASLLRWSADGTRLLAVYPGTRTWRSLEEQGYKGGGSEHGPPRNPAPSVLAVWDVASGEVIARRECPGRVIDGTLDRTGTTIRAAGDDYKFRTWTIGPPATETEVALDPKPKFSHYRVVEVLPDGRLVTWLPPWASVVADVYDVTGQQVARQTGPGFVPPPPPRTTNAPPAIPLRAGPGTVLYPDGRRTDVLSGRLLPTLEVRGLHVSTGRHWCAANAALIACPVEFSGIHFWDTLTGGYVGRLSGPAREWAVVALSPDGRWLAAAGKDDAVELLSVRPGVDAVRLPVKRASALAFSPDGARLAIASRDDGILVWRVPAATANRSEVKASEDWWAALGRSDAAVAWQAPWHLLDQPAEATALLADRLKADASTNTADQIARLDDARYSVREEAAKELAGRGMAVEAELQTALKEPKSAEQRRRLEALLARLVPTVPPEGDELRGLRAVWLLERIGSGEAKKILERLAGGTSSSQVTAEAEAALQRFR